MGLAEAEQMENLLVEKTELVQLKEMLSLMERLNNQRIKKGKGLHLPLRYVSSMFNGSSTKMNSSN